MPKHKRDAPQRPHRQTRKINLPVRLVDVPKPWRNAEGKIIGVMGHDRYKVAVPAAAIGRKGYDMHLTVRVDQVEEL